MSGFSVQVDDRQINASLRSLTASLQDLSKPMRAIGQLLVTETDLNFRSEQDPWGKAWQGLADSTLRRRREGNGKGSNKILRDTGRLANSITYRADSNSVAVGTNVIYAAIHQFGGSPGMAPGPAAIPARPFLPINKQGAADLPAGTADDILDIINVFLLKAANK